jgi:RNA polymerase sigma-70 factor (ECF subfamily)
MDENYMRTQTDSGQVMQHIKASLAGEDGAFAELVKIHEPMLLAFAHYRLPQSEEAVEAVQDTFVRAFEQLPDFRPDADFGTWLRTICRYMILSRVKTYNRRKIKHDDYKGQLVMLALQHLAGPPETSPNLLLSLNACTQELSEVNQGLIHDRYTQALSTQQISEKTGRTVTWVTSTLHRVRSALRTCIENRMKESNHE